MGSKYARQASRALPTNSRRWRAIRAQVLRANPLCVMCMARGLVVEATDVDHMDQDSHNNDMTNLRGLCHSCHSSVTARHGEAKGCDANGDPVGGWG